MASAPDVFCPARGKTRLGRESHRIAGHQCRRSARPAHDLHGAGEALVGRNESLGVTRRPKLCLNRAMTTSLLINGTLHNVEVDSRTSLLDFLRESLGLTGTKKGCD